MADSVIRLAIARVSINLQKKRNQYIFILIYLIFFFRAGTTEASKDEAAINAVIGESAFDGSSGAIPAPPPPGPPGPPPGAILPMPVDQAKMDSEVRKKHQL